MNIPNLFDTVGYFGPIIMLGIAASTIYNRTKYLISYIAFFFINIILNKGLKLAFKQPRPSDHNDTTDILKLRYNGAEIYGFPSGHAQSVGFTVSFLWWITRSLKLLYIGITIMLLTVYQRFKFNKHTIEQLVAGLIVGGIMGYLLFYLLAHRF